jgi:colanic acid biosynthesis glycosyl transferase WcaI
VNTVLHDSLSAPQPQPAARGLRVGYLIQQFPPEVGAGPARAAEMVLRWKEAGADVTVVTGMPNRPEGRIHAEYRGKLVTAEDWQGIRVLRSWLYASPNHGFVRTALNNTTFMATSAAHAAARCGALDVLIASSPPFFVHCAGEVVRRLRQVPLILEVRDLWPDYLVGMGVLKNGAAARQLFALERALLAKASAVVVVTETFKQRIIEKGVSPDRITVIPNGVDTQFYFASNDAAPVPELVRNGNEFIVGYLGNFGAGQQLATVIEAAAMLEQRNAGVRFVLAGDGADREALQRQVDELGLQRVRILPPISKDKTRAFYNSCDACLVPLAPFPVLQETIPSKVFEVMACERPVIASLAGEGARIVQSSQSGLVSAPGDAAAMASAIERVQAMPPEERRAMGARGRLYVGKHYSRDALSARYLELLTAVGRARRGNLALQSVQ